MKKIILINGSLRRESYNQLALDYVKEALTQRGLEVYQEDISNLPFINQDTEFPTPVRIKEIRENIKSANGLFILTPEYNRSYPAQLKNYLDWLSRPEELNQPSFPDYTQGYKVAIAGVGFGSALLALGELERLLKNIKMDVIAKNTAIAISSDVFKGVKFDLTEVDKKNLDEEIEELVKAL